MSVPKGLDGLQFACECVSARRSGYSDPWANVAKKKLLPDGTKEEILNLVAREPKTISQLAESLKLSPPSIYTHINDMMKSELLRESEEWEKKYPTERYYEPNFPVVRADERAEFEALCQEMAESVADLFEQKRTQMEDAFNQTNLAERGWTFSDVSHYLYSCVQRGARRLLEQSGTLPPCEQHKNGVEWVFWAEESDADADRD
ncbi:MAG: winged helix-turn-helix domain-containing protein [Pyrinomonadaceae bacterium]